MSDLLARSGRLLVPHCQAAVAGLPAVWDATSSQTPLRCKCLQVREKRMRFGLSLTVAVAATVALFDACAWGTGHYVDRTHASA